MGDLFLAWPARRSGGGGGGRAGAQCWASPDFFLVARAAAAANDVQKRDAEGRSSFLEGGGGGGSTAGWFRARHSPVYVEGMSPLGPLGSSSSCGVSSGIWKFLSVSADGLKVGGSFLRRGGMVGRVLGSGARAV